MKGMGKSVAKCVVVGEIVKRRIVNLHQIAEISSIRWAPCQPCLQSCSAPELLGIHREPLLPRVLDLVFNHRTYFTSLGPGFCLLAPVIPSRSVRCMALLWP